MKLESIDLFWKFFNALITLPTNTLLKSIHEENGLLFENFDFSRIISYISSYLLNRSGIEMFEEILVTKIIWNFIFQSILQIVSWIDFLKLIIDEVYHP